MMMRRQIGRGEKEGASVVTGFTLLELMVAVTVILVLVGVSVPVFSKVAARGRSVDCMSNLRQIGMALNLYLGEHHMVMPTMVAAREDASSTEDALDTVLDSYVGDLRVFRCKADKEGLWHTTGTSYYWNSTLNGQPMVGLNFMGLTGKQSGIPVVSDKENFHERIGDEVNVLYADGHVAKELRFTVGP